MSYILDALKKAEAERGAGAPHGAQLPPAAATAMPAAPAPHRTPWSWIIAGTLASALAAALAVLAWMRPPQQPAPAVPAMLTQTPPPTPAPPATAAAKRPVAAPVPAEPAKQPQARREALPATAARMPPAKKASSPLATDPAPVPALRDLPDAIQRQIPPLKVGGYIYSSNKAERSVLINDRLLAEGNEAAPGLVLERMLPDGMIMRYQDYRFRIRY